jgi:putative ABC transport system substrate-binding protein
MRRREFMTLVGGAAAVWPVAARAQQSPVAVRRVGVFHPFTEAAEQDVVAALHESMQQLGWTAGRNIQFEHRFGEGDFVRFQAIATELVALGPDVIVVANSPSLQALMQRTKTIPIVFFNVSDPVGSGFVTSLARPGGNVTGFTNNEFSIAGKWLQLIKDVAPAVERTLVLLDPENVTWRGYLRVIESMAPAVGTKVIAAPVIDAAGIEHALADFAREPHGSLVVLPGPVIGLQRASIVGLALQHRLPAVFGDQEAVRLGGLMTYGSDSLDRVRKAGGYVDRILKGEKPRDLPIQQPTKFELIINLKTAKALGLTVPQTLLVTADQVIE